MQSYLDLLNVDEFWDKKENFNDDRWEVSFYCKDCKKIVETNRVDPKWYIFECKECSWKNIVLGTLSGLKENYRIK